MFHDRTKPNNSTRAWEMGMQSQTTELEHGTRTYNAEQNISCVKNERTQSNEIEHDTRQYKAKQLDSNMTKRNKTPNK